ncbi:somatostatin receptor type 5-like [Acanthaster planci]|uniref:Somatostatin receptor type 5-like n=1 Tax=Acanthaster planci TaxID=133434 RepID=A0A8B7YD16_ACAPL|nr:somatostatin receptor type 5-like [Acanthaster planci]XP_022091149.1 somatostatin receptor type 5-like [Acanthaster planci]
MGYESFSSSDPNNWGPPTPGPPVYSVAILLSVLGLFGLVGNACMVYIILRHKHMRTVPNVLILNLAVADLLYILVPTSFYVESLINNIWDLPEWVCKLESYVVHVAQYASVFALTVLSWDRHAAVTKVPLREAKFLRAIALVSIVWLTSGLLSIPALVFAKLDTTNRNCRRSAEDTPTRKVLILVWMLAGFGIPLIVIAFFYLKIAIHICRSTNSKRFPNINVALAKQMRDRKRLAVSVLIIILFFALCWGTFFSYYIGIHFSTTSEAHRNASYIMPIVNTCLDPWLLFAISSNHRASLIGFLCGACRRPKRGARKADLTSGQVKRYTRTGSSGVTGTSAETGSTLLGPATNCNK